MRTFRVILKMIFLLYKFSAFLAKFYAQDLAFLILFGKGRKKLTQLAFTCSKFKVVSATFLLVCFVCLKESTCETRKIFFVSLRELFSFFFFGSNLNFSDIQTSWRHQMPKHETRKNILMNNVGSKLSLLMKFGRFL